MFGERSLISSIQIWNVLVARAKIIHSIVIDLGLMLRVNNLGYLKYVLLIRRSHDL